MVESSTCCDREKAEARRCKAGIIVHPASFLIPSSKEPVAVSALIDYPMRNVGGSFSAAYSFIEQSR